MFTMTNNSTMGGKDEGEELTLHWKEMELRR